MTNGEILDSNHSARIGAPRAGEAIILGGLSVGILDIVEPILFFWLMVGAAPTRVLQGVAAGLIGRDAAVAGGWKTALLGLFLHFFIATSIATVWFIACRAIPALLRRPVLWGILYGIGVYFVMNFIVVPLSAAPRMAFSLPMLLHGLVVHALFVGLPVAVIAAWSAQRR